MHRLFDTQLHVSEASVLACDSVRYREGYVSHSRFINSGERLTRSVTAAAATVALSAGPLLLGSWQAAQVWPRPHPDGSNQSGADQGRAVTDGSSPPHPPQQVTHSQVVDVNLFCAFSRFKMFLLAAHVFTLFHLQSIIFIDNLLLMRQFIS